MVQTRPPDAGLLSDLASRFVMNLPEDEIATFDNTMFMVEQAHWFYEDFYREQDPTLKATGLKEFAKLFFAACPELCPNQALQEMDELYKSWTEYRHKVPVYGAICLNTALDKCIMVKGWKSGSSYGFPKGKINRGEREADCAVREVLEEIGLDISEIVDENAFIELTIGEQKTTLFIVHGVDESIPLITQTRKEISEIKWMSINDLPSYKKGTNVEKGTMDKGKFYLVFPFVGHLKKWIKDKKRGKGNKNVKYLTPLPAPKQNEKQQLQLRQQQQQQQLQASGFAPYFQFDRNKIMEAFDSAL